MKRTSHSCAVRIALAAVPISACRDTRAALESGAFSPAEQRRLRLAPPRSIAGALALKRAAMALTNDTHARGAASTERMFTVGHARNGAPQLAVAPRALPAAPHIKVSLSHTRDTAYGLAATDSRAKRAKGGCA